MFSGPNVFGFSLIKLILGYLYYTLQFWKETFDF